MGVGRRVLKTAGVALVSLGLTAMGSSGCGEDTVVRLALRTLPTEDPYQGVATFVFTIEVGSPGRVGAQVELDADQTVFELPPVATDERVRVLVDGYASGDPPTRLSAGISDWVETGGSTVSIDVCFCRLETFEAGACVCGD